MTAHGAPLPDVLVARAEAAFVAGDWDAASRWGWQVLDLAVADPLARDALVRASGLLAPIAAYRADAAVLRALPDLGPLPGTPRTLLVDSALDHLVAAGTDADPATPDPERLLESWTLPDDDPGWVAARDAVLRAWWDAGWFDALLVALDAMPLDAIGAPLATGAALLWRARMGEDEDSVVGRAREALRLVRREGAAWWIEQAIGVLDDAGDATHDERAERRAVRLRLLGDPAA